MLSESNLFGRFSIEPGRQPILTHQIQPKAVLNLMTPGEVLVQIEHEPEIIDPTRYLSFDSLLNARESIRNLRLVPRRSDEIQKAYEQMGRNDFLNIVRNHYLNGSVLAFVRELFPSDLPPDTGQYVFWIKESDLDNFTIAQHLAEVMETFGLGINDVILFERSRVTQTEFVKAAIPEFRHIHVWTRGRIIETSTN
ncbi:hypothetical protein A2160_04540 [Candidatus Beckwithbacteria bacterium RBG_13_42_9]|uniref:Uncharacterized protein n=1 Tax=Candidatus Beckwithbacteria bacterium RBG_13_42_9 TaxID=1797457 RepID=A0A1F5E9P1_9BACT|nr:MAG: hypothetical protein A2160_04540 [Candidatus Beckwithbacteria bacterium RBG_13_42_9]